MSFESVELDITSRFSANIGVPKSQWTVDGEYEFIAPKNIDWFRLTIKDGESGALELGSNTTRDRNEGTIIVQIFVPKKSGSRKARGYADSIATIFRHKQFGTPTITTRAPSVDNIGEQDGYQRFNVLIPYHWDLDS